LTLDRHLVLERKRNSAEISRFTVIVRIGLRLCRRRKCRNHHVHEITASNFLSLVDGGHLDAATFYRTVSPENDNGTPAISVIQGGLGDASEAFEAVAHETTDKTGIPHKDGTISMARGGPGTASTEFFICVGDQPALDFGGNRNTDQFGFAAFGRVIDGMDVVKAIHNSPSDTAVDDDYFKGQILENPVLIERVTRKIPLQSTP
jgi:peptidyl-prolyl cis-trans isomerase A (cyclophilin A)